MPEERSARARGPSRDSDELRCVHVASTRINFFTQYSVRARDRDTYSRRKNTITDQRARDA